MYVVAARPGQGKTVVAAQIAAQLAGTGNVAFASLEMTSEELVDRFVAERLQINVIARDPTRDEGSGPSQDFSWSLGGSFSGSRCGGPAICELASTESL